MLDRRVTMKDLAKATGFSVNTVSRALNDKPDVSPETKRQIIKVAERLRYVPNQLAQGLRGKHTRSIGVVVADIANPFFAEVLQGIERAGFERGYAITVGNASEDPAKESKLVAALVEQRVAGLLITPTQRSQDFVELLRARGVPFVLIARRFDHISTNAVLNDDYMGAYQAVDYLIRQGRRRILFLNGPDPIWSARQRLQGYRSAGQDHGLPASADLVHTCEPTMQSAYRTLGALLARPGPSFDAVFTFNDYMALGAIKALRQRGLRIPDDVAVMGYDGIDIGEMVEPALSTVAIDRPRLGSEAARILIQALERPPGDGTPRQVSFPPQLVIRESA